MGSSIKARTTTPRPRQSAARVTTSSLPGWAPQLLKSLWRWEVRSGGAEKERRGRAGVHGHGSCHSWEVRMEEQSNHHEEAGHGRGAASTSARAPTGGDGGEEGARAGVYSGELRLSA